MEGSSRKVFLKKWWRFADDGWWAFPLFEMSAGGFELLFWGFLEVRSTPAFNSGVPLNIQYAKNTHSRSAPFGTADRESLEL